MLVELVEETIADAEARKDAIEAELETLREIKALAGRLNGGGSATSSAAAPAQASRPAAARPTQPRREAAADPPSRSRASRPARKASAGRRSGHSASRSKGQPEQPPTTERPAGGGDRKPEARLEILKVLELRGEATQSALADAIGRDQGTVSLACKRLEEAGKITRRREGKSMVCRLPDARDRENGVADAEQVRTEVKAQILEVLREHGDGRQGLDIFNLLDPSPTDSAFGHAIAELQKEGRVVRAPRNGRMVFVLTNKE